MEALARRLQTFSSAAVVDFPWASLARIVRPRPGNLIITTAAPGVGKSTFALDWTVTLVSKGDPVLYLSLDTPLHDQAARFCARWNNMATDDVENDIDHWAKWLVDLKLPLRFSDLPMNAEEITKLVEAESQWFGEYPRLIVVDNMADVVEEESQAEYKAAFAELHQLARKTKSVVLALHHIKRGKEEQTNGLVPPTMGDGLFGGEHGTQIMLGLWRPQEGHMNVAVLKNRMGQAAANGALFVPLRCNLTNSFIWEGQEALEETA